MQPKTDTPLDSKALKRLMRKAKNISISHRMRKRDPGYFSALPQEIGLQLTYRCNLRCAHCFQWNNEGFFHTLDEDVKRQDLDFSIVEKVFYETRDQKSNLYLWGGEPLIYKHWDELAALLYQDPRWTVICTNAVVIDKKLDSLLKISENCVLLVSIEGFAEANDFVRGKGTFRKIMDNLNLLFKLKEQGRFKGLISINTVINDRIIPDLFDFVSFFEEKPIDSFYISFGWYIPKKTALSMDDYYSRNFDWMAPLSASPSWHSFDYTISSSLTEPLRKNVEKILGKTWKKRVKFQPPLELSEIGSFVKGEGGTVAGKKECLGLTYRMDVLPGGEVSACKLFPELLVGNLAASSLQEVWQGEAYKKVREKLCTGLMPLCCRCVLLYLHGK